MKMTGNAEQCCCAVLTSEERLADAWVGFSRGQVGHHERHQVGGHRHRLLVNVPYEARLVLAVNQTNWSAREHRQSDTMKPFLEPSTRERYECTEVKFSGIH